MANIKFSQFTQKTTLGTVDFLVGYTGADNVQIDPADLLSDYSQGTGTAGQVTFFSATSTVTGDNNLYWDNTNKRLGIGTTTPVAKLEISDSSNPNLRLRNVSANASNSGTIEFREQDLNVGAFVKYNGDANIFQIGTRTGSTDYARINILRDSGDVGIGTSSPAAKLQVSGTLIATGVSQLGSGGSNVYLTSSSAGNVGIGTSSPPQKLSVNGNISIQNGDGGLLTFNNGDADIVVNYNGGGRDLSFKTYDGSSNTERMRITKDGKVGIGTTSPTDTLTISNDNNLLLGLDAPAGNDGQLRFYSSGTWKSIIYRPANSNDLRFNTATSGDVLTIQQGGNVGIGTTSPNSTTKLHISSPQSGAASGTGMTLSGWNGSGESRVQLMSYGISDGTLAIRTGTSNTERMRITSAGNVGIGDAAPVNLSANTFSLSVNSARNDLTGALVSRSNGNTKHQQYWDSAGYNFDLTASSGDFKWRVGGSEKMRITSSGNVGIGITSPVAKLHVYQNNSDDDTTAGVTIEQDGTGDSALSFLLSGIRRWRLGIDNNDSDKFKISSATNLATNNKLTIDVDGNVGIGTSSPQQRLTVGDGSGSEIISIYAGNANASALHFTDTNTSTDYQGFVSYNHSSDALRFGTAEVERMRITSAGNVGIGTTNPGFKLEVSGGGTKSPFYTSDGGRGFKMDSVSLVGTYSEGSDANGANDIGSNSNKWRDAYFAGDINFGDSHFIGDDGNDNLLLQSSSGEAVIINGDTNVKLQDGGNTKLTTTSTGATVTGTLIAATGDLETSGVGYGLILKSPDGTRYRVTVANGGTLSVSAV